MTTDELMALKAEAEAATPGPYFVEPFVDGIEIRTTDGAKIADIADRSIHAKGMPPDNARYIVAACNAVPGLVDEVLRLREMRERCAMLAEERITKDEDFIEYDDGQCSNAVACKMIAAAIRALK